MKTDVKTIVIEATPCPQCGQPMPPGALAGLCPACLLAQGLDTDASGSPNEHRFAPPSLDEVARLFPQLEILGLLGAGGMGAVYQARQPALDRMVALKILPAKGAGGANFEERFNREARALARLNHPNIVAVYEFGRTPPQTPDAIPHPLPSLHFFIMEFVDGANLRQLEKAGRLAPREALQIIPQICDALQYAHDEGVVHRDIKPENVLVDRKGRVKIADFGLAKILGGENESSRLTVEGQVMGTPHYMAPEQVEKPLSVDHRADIYALGVVFYEMLTGDLPLGKFSPPSRKYQLDVRLDDVVLRALENDPARRYQNASEVKTQVENIAGTPAPAPTAPEPRPVRWAGFPLVTEHEGKRRVNRKEAFKMFAIFFGLLTVAFGLVSLFHGQNLFGWLGISGSASLQVRLLVAALATAFGAWRALQSKTASAPAFVKSGRDGKNSDLAPAGAARPGSLLFVAALFIVTGGLAAWEVGRSLHMQTHSLNFGALALPVGIGLWRLRPRWRAAALVMLWLPLVLAALAGIAAMSGNLHLRSITTVKLLGHTLEGSAGLLGALAAGVVWFALFVWSNHVLLRADVVVLFQRRGWSRPWLEWAALAGVILLGFVASPGNGQSLASLLRGGFSAGKNSPAQIAIPDHATGTQRAQLTPRGTVELLAVSDAGSAPNEWWTPDGRAVPDKLYELGRIGSVQSEGRTNKDFVLHLRDLPAGVSAPQIEFNLSGGSTSGGEVWRDGKKSSGAWPVRAAFLPDATETTLRVGFELEAWQVISIHDRNGNRQAGLAASHLPRINAQAHEVGEENGEARLTLLLTPPGDDWKLRVIAVDTAGRERTQTRSTATPTGPTAVQSYEFFQLPRAQVKEFQVQVRPVHWIEFRNVKLTPKDRNALGKSTRPFKPTAFSEVKEVQITRAFDFDTALAPQPPDEVTAGPGPYQMVKSSWARENGVDVVATSQLLLMAGMEVADLTLDEWDSQQPEKLADRLVRSLYAPLFLPRDYTAQMALKENSAVPLNYAFRTRSMGLGMMQLIHIFNDRITLRYKMIERAHFE